MNVLTDWSGRHGNMLGSTRVPYTADQQRAGHQQHGLDDLHPGGALHTAQGDVDDRSPDRIDALDTVVFLAELCLLAVLAWSGARLGTGAWAVLLSIALPLTAAVLWALLLAPRSARRPRHPARLIVKLVLSGAAAAALAVSGEVLWATGFLVLTATVTIAGELRAARGHAPHP